MSEYMEKFSVSRLIGSPPGYVGYEEGGQLTEKIKNNPFSVILFDEIEKAHPDVFNILLQILDDGVLTDSFGRRVDFTNTIIIMTSNVGAKQVLDYGGGIGFGRTISDIEENKINIINKELKNKFKPEFLNRVDEIILFNALKEPELRIICDNELNTLKNRLNELSYNISFDESIREEILKQNKEETYGARPIKRIITRLLEDFISEEILKQNIVNNKEYILFFEENEVKIKL